MINGLLWQVAGTRALIYFPCIKAHVPMGAKIVSRKKTWQKYGIYLIHLSSNVLQDHRVLDPDADHRGKTGAAQTAFL